MRIGGIFLGMAAVVAIGGVSVAQQPASAPPAVRAPGYLTAQAAPNGALILPPAPKEGTDRFMQDRAVFRATRILEGTDRWKLAQDDDKLTIPDMMQHFSCSVGVSMTQANAPRTYALLNRAATDASRVSNGAKDVFKRRRPFHFDEGNICIPHTESFDASLDYPSGHTTRGWTMGLILAELSPETATPILVRARAYGESRVVCGVHNASAIEGGRTAGAITFAAQHGSPEFRADMDAARTEIAALKRGGDYMPDAATCQAQAALIARTPYPQ